MQEQLSTWAQWGPLGAITLVQVTALGVVGRWLIASKDRADQQLIELVKEAQSVSTQNAAINAQTAAVLARLVATTDAINAKAGEIDQEVVRAAEHHRRTHDGIERIEASIAERVLRAGRSPLASIIVLLGVFSAALHA